VANADWIKAHLEEPDVKIIDARDARSYRGIVGQPRSGHIPNAQSLSVSTLLDSTNRLKSKAELYKAFMSVGVKPGMEVVSYCHVGQLASLVYFTARYLGYDARLYDGSFEDWSGRDDLPVVNASAAAKK
jgi:thiosulfate/3-mercaptopyruvate sulfurtransferase